MWRNDRGGKWDCRIIWYANSDDTDIRLKMENTERIWNEIFRGETAVTDAQKVWDAFKVKYMRA